MPIYARISERRDISGGNLCLGRRQLSNAFPMKTTPSGWEVIVFSSHRTGCLDTESQLAVRLAFLVVYFGQ
jgi:hypothetical protein